MVVVDVPIGSPRPVWTRRHAPSIVDLMDGPPGHLVSIGTHALHITCQGTGGPAVIFDAALGASSVSWVLVQPKVARVTRTCAYDRAGLGWSEAGPLPRTAGRAAAELRELLRRAGIPPPYLLVGHSSADS